MKIPGTKAMLRRFPLPAALLLITLASASASAGEIVFETRATTTTVMPWDALGSWNAQTSPITASELLSFNNVFSPGRNRHSRLQVEFDVGGSAPWEFEFGLDAGLGAAIYLNGELQTAASDDRWWGYNWNATDELLRLAGAMFMQGTNTLTVYWAENCCAGGQSARFRAGSSEWQTLTTANLQQIAEPSAMTLLCAGIIALTASRRRRCSGLSGL